MKPALPAELVGSRLRPFETSFEPRDLAAYAAVIAPHHRLHFDDEADANPPAPPLFAVALTWKLIKNLGQLLEVPVPAELLARAVHFAEELEIRRLIRAGETLRLAGAVGAMLPHAMGTRLILQLTCTDLTDSIVYKEQLEALLLGVEGPIAPILQAPLTPLTTLTTYTSPIRNVPTIPGAPLQIPRELPYLYDAASGISAPIHVSPRFAKSVGLPDIILHGTCSAGLAVTALVDRFAEGDPRRVRAFACKFRGLVLPPTELQLEITALDETPEETQIAFHLNTKDGTSALRDAFLRLSRSE